MHERRWVSGLRGPQAARCAAFMPPRQTSCWPAGSCAHLLLLLPQPDEVGGHMLLRLPSLGVVVRPPASGAQQQQGVGSTDDWASHALQEHTLEHSAAEHSTAEHSAAQRPHLIRYLRIVPRWRMPITASACGDAQEGWGEPGFRAMHLQCHRDSYSAGSSRRHGPRRAAAGTARPPLALSTCTVEGKAATAPGILHPSANTAQLRASHATPSERAIEPVRKQLQGPSITCAYSSPLS